MQEQKPNMGYVQAIEWSSNLNEQHIRENSDFLNDEAQTEEEVK